MLNTGNVTDGVLMRPAILWQVVRWVGLPFSSQHLISQWRKMKHFVLGILPLTILIKKFSLRNMVLFIILQWS